MTTRLQDYSETADREMVIRLHSGQIAFAFLVCLLAALGWLYFATQRAVRVVVNDQPLELRTHQRTIGRLLDEQGFRLNDADVILPPTNTPLDAVETVQLWLAQPVEVEADGQVWRILTQSGGVADVLQALNIPLTREDRLWFEDGELPVTTLLSQLHPAPLDPRAERAPVRFSVQRAQPVHVSDDGVALNIRTFAQTVRDVLREHDIRIHQNDRISPALNHVVSAGTHILIERSKPLTIVVDGKPRAAHTRELTIARALAEAGIRLQGKDYTMPPAQSPVFDNMTVQVVRVREEFVEEASPIAYAKLLQPDDNLEIDRQELRQRGQNGEHRKLIRVVYENGQETQRVVEKEWDARAPTPQITVYGRKIVVRELMTPHGPIQYWRAVRMYATSYSPARSGTSPDKPWYGRTSAGLIAGKGVIAVDQSVVPWLSKLYVPGYGIAIAGDTGGGVRGKLIDLGFEDHTYESWHYWLEVYWLTPLPDPQTIRWILPSYPVERPR